MAQAFGFTAFFNRIPCRGPAVRHKNTVTIGIIFSKARGNLHIQKMPHSGTGIGAVGQFWQIIGDQISEVQQAAPNQHPRQ